ncbi:unnamed protein product [Ceutorhynchus assimilis]|uniref:Uncharacterized protein n=1 Tax=Ceutorhynchus assimilis TaxID=467358 RepID=A0A9N9MHP0_9CUCU|nr:unnamed protein product [Ceutorhynchus assimilis]
MEEDIQKKLVSLCNLLPVHVDLWKTILQSLQSPVKALGNFAEQLQFVEKATNTYMDDFEELQRQLGTKILENIEEELQAIKTLMETLDKSNHNLKNKLAILEKSTIDLDWDNDSFITKGTPIQPPLRQILQMAYEFWLYFSRASKTINSELKNINFRDEKSMEQLQNAFSLSLEVHNNREVYGILALTQYVVNEKAVT